jgi:hypothetical protein
MVSAIPIRLAVESSGSALFNRVRQLRELEVLRVHLERELDRLGQALLRSGAKNPDDLVRVPGGLDHPEEPGELSVKAIEDQRKGERSWRRVREMAQGLPAHAREVIRQKLLELQLHRQCEVQARIESLNARLAAVQTASSVMLVSLRQSVCVTQVA